MYDLLSILQEYPSGSHDKTFEIAAKGTVIVTDAAGNAIFSHEVNPGDIYRFHLPATENDQQCNVSGCARLRTPPSATGSSCA